MSWLDFPTVVFPEELVLVKSGSFQLMPAGQILGVGSPFSTISRAVANTAQLWMAKLQFGTLYEWQAVVAFITSLNGVETLFRMHDPARLLPTGVAGGWNARGDSTPVYFDDGVGGLWGFSDGRALTAGETSALVGADARAGDNSLHLKGLVPDAATGFLPGDLLELHKNLYEVLRPAPTNTDGETRVLVRPTLRKGAIVDDPVNLWKPKARFMLAAPNEGLADRFGGGLGTLALNAIEVPFL